MSINVSGEEYGSTNPNTPEEDNRTPTILEEEGNTTRSVQEQEGSRIQEDPQEEAEAVSWIILFVQDFLNGLKGVQSNR